MNYVFKEKFDAMLAAPPPAPAPADRSLAALEHTRTNSRRGAIDPSRRSYPPVEAVHRALEVLRAVNKLRIASVNGIHEQTGINKSTIVRMLETLMGEGDWGRPIARRIYAQTRAGYHAVTREGVDKIVK